MATTSSREKSYHRVCFSSKMVGMDQPHSLRNSIKETLNKSILGFSETAHILYRRRLRTYAELP